MSSEWNLKIDDKCMFLFMLTVRGCGFRFLKLLSERKQKVALAEARIRSEVIGFGLGHAMPQSESFNGDVRVEINAIGPFRACEACFVL